MGALRRGARPAERNRGGQSLSRQSRHRLPRAGRRNDRVGPRQRPRRRISPRATAVASRHLPRRSANRRKKQPPSWQQYDARLPFVAKLFHIEQEKASRTGITRLYDGALRHWNHIRTALEGPRSLLVRGGKVPRYRSEAFLVRPASRSRRDAQGIQRAGSGPGCETHKTLDEGRLSANGRHPAFANA